MKTAKKLITAGAARTIKRKKRSIVSILCAWSILIAFTGQSLNVYAETKPQNINAQAYILMEAESLRVLCEKRSDVKMAMASLTKMMTAVVAAENGDIDDTVIISERAGRIGGSKVGLKKGDKAELRELMYAMLMNSGNDAAIAIAEHIGGSVEKFVEMMNIKAKGMGLENTSFANPHGLDAAGHYSTAHDMAKLAVYAEKIPIIAAITATKQKTVSFRTLNNTNEMLSAYKGVVGVKTGFTGNAGRCLATMAVKDDMKLISVVLNCPTKKARTKSSIDLLDYGFGEFSMKTVGVCEEVMGTSAVIRGKKDTVEAILMEDVHLPFTEEELRILERKVDIKKSLEAPVSIGQSLGTLNIEADGEIIASYELTAKSEIAKKEFVDYIYDAAKIFADIFSFKCGDSVNVL